MTAKIAISLPEKTLAMAKAVVRKGGAPSVSGYIATLIEEKDREESFEEMLNRWDREDGRTPDEVARGLAQAQKDFERAGLIPKKVKRKVR
jgi:hypothetical protein